MNTRTEKIKLLARLKEIMVMNDTPEKIAGGTALGIFLGIFPGLGVVAALLVAGILRLNKLAAVVGALLTNTWSSLVFIPLVVWGYALVFDVRVDAVYVTISQAYQNHSWLLLSRLIFSQAWPLALALTIVAMVFAVACYLIIVLALRCFRKTRVINN